MHVPVLADTAKGWLGLRGDGKYVDCTAGAGGHAVLIAQGAGPRGHLIAIDRDATAVALARERLRDYPWAEVVQGNYGDIETILAERDMAHVDGVLIDAGMSSMQLDDTSRGFSFQADGPLDMRMDPAAKQSAADWLRTVPEPGLAEALHEYGEVRNARRVAKAIVARRETKPLRTTGDLVEAVLDSLGSARGKPGEPLHGFRADLVRQVFQAVRIVVNEELRDLERGLRGAVNVLARGGRLVLISFQSGEDRVWKRVMNEVARDQKRLTPDGRVAESLPATMRVLTKHPVKPTPEEIAANPRAHSARLRAAERI